jgi:DNA repair protein RecO (recombination protein O)
MKNKTVNAIILSRRDFGEADRLISAFSLEEGKIKIIAKGSRKIKSKMASHIEPFTIGKYQLIKGKTFYILTGAEKENTNNELSESIELYKDASYICEITDLTMHEGEAERELYGLLKEVLIKLSSINENQKQILLRYFEFRLLRALGYKPDYKKCLKCNNQIIEMDSYQGGFEGVLCCKEAGKTLKINKNTLKILRLFQDKNLEEILNINNTGTYDNDLKEVILPFFYDILPRKPKSQEL